MEKDDMTYGDATCSLNFHKYFLIEKDGMVWDDVPYLRIEIIEINAL
jgi:hypothetical protein